jgi:alpha-glucosidase
MKLLLRQIIPALFFIVFTLMSCTAESKTYPVSSPDGKIAIQFKAVKGELFYSVHKEGKQILFDSRLGFTFTKGDTFNKNFKILKTETSVFDKTWEQPWGESREVRNDYKELKIFLQETKGHKRYLNIIFRVFNDGYGFRYEFPEQPNLKDFEIAKENTEFHFAKQSNAWWIPAYKEAYYESLARYTTFSKMDTVCTPLTIETGDGKYLAIHEANLTDYAKMNLYPKDSVTLACDLSPWSNGIKVYATAPFVTPWRTMIIAENINELVTSNIMLNLNEPSEIIDMSWIKPGRYMGIWWEIHLEKYTWSSGPKHGATTTNTKAYIDFAAANGFSGVLVEGWNVGWDGDWTKNGLSLDFTKAYPDFDIKEVTDYAKSKGIELIGHHETAGMATHYQDQLDNAFGFYQGYGVHVVKTGYVNPKLDNKELHDGQFAVRHYRKVVETAAKYHIMIDNHEPVMPTGIQRTWPNLMTQEAIRGQEYDAWATDGGSPPDHTTVFPFLRGLAGPMDFTPGTFNFENPTRKDTRVRTTIAKQLALFVVVYSPLQMASDAPENYRGVRAFDFIKSVPTTWEKTVIPDAKIGDYAIFARKDRNSENWFMGCITDENARELSLNLSFLDKNATYIAHIYSDGEGANWKTNPTAVKYEEKEVNSMQIIQVALAPGGGCAIHYVKKK